MTPSRKVHNFMGCYHPLKGFQIGINSLTGKPIYKVTSYSVDFIVYDRFKDKYFSYTQDMKDYFIKNTFFKIIDDFIEIPCGKCISCRIKYSQEWAIRCMLESSYHKNNFFITLTYNDNQVVRSTYLNDDGFECESLTLFKRDFQLFMKRLRKKYSKYCSNHGILDDKIRFYACGEYGDSTARPHYHAILFGIDIPDLVPRDTKSSLGHVYYNSKFLEECWTDPDSKQQKGHVIIGNVTYQSCAYVARYIMKKQKGQNASVYEKYNIEPEFSLMSRKPGIGKDYFDSNWMDIYKHDDMSESGLLLSRNGKPPKPPKYYDCLLEKDFPDIFNSIKEKRVEIAQDLKMQKILSSSLPYDKLLEIEEDNKKRQLSKLVRLVE